MIELKRDSVQTEILVITPEMAEFMLESNGLNRKLSVRIANRYAGTMKAGNWVLNGEGIIFSKDGRLLDGQHRLFAVSVAGVDVPMQVTFGIDDDAFATIDDGKKRSAGDIFTINGVKNATHTAAACRVAIGLANGYTSMDIGPHHATTNSEIYRWYKKYNELFNIDAIVAEAQIFRMHSSNLMRVSLISSTKMFTDFMDKDKSYHFWNMLIYGGFEPGNPAFTLRKMYMTDRSHSTSKLTASVKKRLLYKAWNHALEGKQTKSIRLKNNEYPELLDSTLKKLFGLE